MGSLLTPLTDKARVSTLSYNAGVMVVIIEHLFYLERVLHAGFGDK